jgi:hypothetical protein
MQTATHDVTGTHPGAADNAPMQRAHDEFVEMPGLNLTLPQAARLFGVTVADAERFLSDMVHDRFLEQDTNGLYKRRGCRHCWS